MKDSFLFNLSCLFYSLGDGSGSRRYIRKENYDVDDFIFGFLRTLDE